MRTYYYIVVTDSDAPEGYVNRFTDFVPEGPLAHETYLATASKEEAEKRCEKLRAMKYKNPRIGTLILED